MKSVTKSLSASLIVVLCLIIIPLETNSACFDREERVNTGFCTKNPDYLDGHIVCIPAGVSCDGDDAFPPIIAP